MAERPLPCRAAPRHFDPQDGSVCACYRRHTNACAQTRFGLTCDCDGPPRSGRNAS